MVTTEQDLLLTLEEPFNIDQLIQHEAQKQREQEPDSVERRNHARFQEICEIVKTALRKVIDIGDIDSQQSDTEWLERQHLAVIGDVKAVQYFMEEIQRVLRDRNISFREYPVYHSSLAESIFHEVWGLSVLAKWERYQDSEAAVIHGTDLWIDFGGGKGFELQSEQFASNAVVERVKRAFIHRREDSILNRENPEIEIEREDGSRITMIQPPRSRENYVMFRRFVVKRFTLEDQAARDTIPVRDIPIFRALARTMPNTIIAGPVRSAKSTFMKTMVGERPKNLIGAVLEKHFELALSEHFPGQLFFELQSTEGDLHKVIPRLLRLEHDFVVVGEIRSMEIEAFLQSTERGERGALSTYHLTDVHRVVEQLTRHTLDEFPTRRFEIEMERVANALDIVITMTSDRDRKKKWVTGVSEIYWDYHEREHKVNQLIQYSSLTGKYYYSANISKRLLRLMAEENLEETKILLNLLKIRSMESPIEDLMSFNELDNLLEGDT